MSVDDERLLEYLKRVTIELQDARGRLEELETSRREPIAIVGIGCRYPGDVSTPEQLWDLLAEGGDAISKLPTNRGWDVDSIHGLSAALPEAAWNGESGFLHDAGDFDAGFFGIGRREALMMDPQQRILLETSWEAIEAAGIDPLALRGSETAVFAGVATQDHSLRLSGLPLSEDMGAYLSMGSTGSVLSGRIAYLLGLQGPAVTLDTACSSSLVALHLACDSLRTGQSSLALAGGVTVLSTPMLYLGMLGQQGLALDGRCKSFADAADGTAFSEGAGMVLLERLHDAHRQGHPVLAVIAGSAFNQDGASNGLTAPNGLAQERVIRQALAAAGLTAQMVDAVEAHGTGTVLGDPIEAEAIIATYGSHRPSGRPLWLGSVKSNIGHAQGAAGVAGVIKIVMALRHELLPRTLHLGTPTSPTTKVDWSHSGVSLLSEAVAWAPGAEPRRAGVSSFGVSGTNAHLIVEEAPPLPADAAAAGPDRAGSGADRAGSGAGRTGSRDARAGSGVDRTGLLARGVVPCVISAKTPAALRGQAARLGEWLTATPDRNLLDVGYSLARTRSAFDHRAVVVAGDVQELRAGADALARADAAATAGRVAGGGKVAFVFPGHGSQWAGMGLELLDCSPVFAESLNACEEALSPHQEWSLADVLHGRPGAPSLERIDVVQPLLFALMVSTARLWEACGVRPDAVVGHSQGELAAAHIAGGLSLADAARVVALRSRVLADLAGKGAMASVALGAERLQPLLEGYGGRVVLAAENGPAAAVVSGDGEALSELERDLTARGVRVKRVVGAVGAGHSPRIEPLRERLLDACSQISPRGGDVAFYSTVTAERLDTAAADAAYWYRNAREPVRFERTIRRLLGDGFRAFVELSPHPLLSTAITDAIDASPQDPGAARVIGSSRRDDGGAKRFLTSLGEAWAGGLEVDWTAVFAGSGARKVALPTYAFQRERHWYLPQDHSGTPTPPFAPVATTSAQAPDAATPALAPAEQAAAPNGHSDALLAQQLADAPPEERVETILRAVREQIAAVLAHLSPEEIDPDTNLLELGFESMTALELRSRLNAIAALHIPVAALLDSPTPASLAAYIDSRLRSASPLPGSGSLPAPAGSGGTLVGMLRHARAAGAAGEFTEMLMSASRFHPAFDVAAAHELDLLSATLSEGSAANELICLPTALALSGPHQYARFAKAFAGERAVCALALPGFAPGERVPESLDAAVEALAVAVERHRSGTGAHAPCVLVGYSSGGWLANELACRLQRDAHAPTVAALVLLDSYPLADRPSGESLLGALIGALSEEMLGFVSDERLTAMGAYLRLLSDWRPLQTTVPTLLVRAGEPLPGEDPLDRRHWEHACREVEVPGNHITMIEEHVDATARAVREWLSATLEGERVMDAC
jgi:polyketide synthase 7